YPYKFYQPTALFSFFFNTTTPPALYTLSLHDALPIFSPVGAASAREHTRHVSVSRREDRPHQRREPEAGFGELHARLLLRPVLIDRKSTRLNSSHSQISYAVFCLKKKKKNYEKFKVMK